VHVIEQAARDVVRIDLPVDQAAAMADALNKKCRAEVPGIYFDFDKATIKPQSEPALEQLAAVIRKLGSGKIRYGSPNNTDIASRRCCVSMQPGRKTRANRISEPFGARYGGAARIDAES
jgi:hypothetical protein